MYIIIQLYFLKHFLSDKPALPVGYGENKILHKNIFSIPAMKILSAVTQVTFLLKVAWSSKSIIFKLMTDLPLIKARSPGLKQILPQPILQHFCLLFSVQSSSYLHWSMVSGGHLWENFRERSGHCPTLTPVVWKTKSTKEKAGCKCERLLVHYEVCPLKKKNIYIYILFLK